MGLGDLGRHDFLLCGEASRLVGEFVRSLLQEFQTCHAVVKPTVLPPDGW